MLDDNGYHGRYDDDNDVDDNDDDDTVGDTVDYDDDSDRDNDYGGNHNYDITKRFLISIVFNYPFIVPTYIYIFLCI